MNLCDKDILTHHTHFVNAFFQINPIMKRYACSFEQAYFNFSSTVLALQADKRKWQESKQTYPYSSKW